MDAAQQRDETAMECGRISAIIRSLADGTVIRPGTAPGVPRTKRRFSAHLLAACAMFTLAGCNFGMGAASTTTSAQSKPASCVNTTEVTPTFNGQPVQGFGASTHDVTINYGQVFGVGESAGVQEVPNISTAPQFPWVAPTVTPQDVLKAVPPCPTKTPEPLPTVPSASLYYQGVKPGRALLTAPISKDWLAAPKPCDADPAGCQTIAPISISVTVSG
jgi:hypothetical protein